jgi:hypothetical protein
LQSFRDRSLLAGGEVAPDYQASKDRGLWQPAKPWLDNKLKTSILKKNKKKGISVKKFPVFS